MVIDIINDPEPVMIGMMIIAEEAPDGGLSGNCGGVAITNGSVPGSGGRSRAGRRSSLTDTSVSPVF
ncbi:hypothetical protein [Nocardiopsis nanhaiensis]